MSKLLQLKEWVCFEDAADYLSKAWDEVISVQDLVELVIQKKLAVSLFLPYEIKLIPPPERQHVGYASGLVDVFWPHIEWEIINDDYLYRPGKDIGLTHKGETWWFEQDEQGEFYLSDVPWGHFGNVDPPYETQLVIRTKTLNDLIDKLSDTNTNKPKEDTKNPKAIDSLLKMVVAMAVDCYGYEPAAARNTATNDIVKAVEAIGKKIDNDTVRNWLKKGNQYLDELED